jgi:mono/diheme cytochrome c family protein
VNHLARLPVRTVTDAHAPARPRSAHERTCMTRIVTALALALGLATSAHAAADGAALFKAKCAACHGQNAEGARMSPNPIAGTAAETVKAAITSGKGKMKPVKSVSAEEADAIAQHVAGLKKP